MLRVQVDADDADRAHDGERQLWAVADNLVLAQVSGDESSPSQRRFLVTKHGVGGICHHKQVLHTRQDLADFQNGETRLVYARYKDGRPGLYYVQDGTAHDLRAFVRNDLLCPLPDCPMPALKVVARHPRGRDGFSHLPGAGGHAAESLFHIQGKARIAQWLREKYPLSDVREEEASNADRNRVADVMMTSPGGEKVAVEIQYAALTPAEWALRHQSYVDQGIADVWLFGHAGAQRRSREPRYSSDDDVKLNPTHNAVVAAGLPLLWLNPILGQVATATEDLHFERRTFTVPAGDRTGYTRIEVLDAFEIKADGMWSDATRRYSRNNDEFDTAQRLAEVRKMREEEDARERRRVEAEGKARSLAEWEASELRAVLLEHFDGQWPAFLDVATPVMAAVPNQQWQAQLFQARKSLADETGRLWRKACLAMLPEVFHSEANGYIAVSMWFETLVAYRYLNRVPFYRNGKSNYQYLLTDPAEWEAKQKARYPATAARDPAAFKVDPTRFSRAFGLDQPDRYRSAPTQSPQLTASTRCPICRMPAHQSLDEMCVPY